MSSIEEIRVSAIDLSTTLNTPLEIVGLLTGVEVAQTKAGADYLKITLIDHETQFLGNCWDLKLVHTPTLQASLGEVVRITGKASTYGVNNAISFSVKTANVLTNEELAALGVTKTDFYNVVNNRTALAADLSNYIALISETVYGKIVHQAIQNNWTLFSHVAAGKTVHHTAVGGLLLHTVEVIKVADNFYKMSVDLGYDCLNRALIIAGAAIHDIGKCMELETSAVGSSEYTANSILASHHLSGIAMVVEAATQLGLQNTAECAELCHMIAAHHEKQEWGQLKDPALIEAVLVSKADYISACLNGVYPTLSKANPGEQYQGYGYKNNWVKSMGTYNDDKAI